MPRFADVNDTVRPQSNNNVAPPTDRVSITTQVGCAHPAPASVSDLDGTFSYLISTADGIGCARDRFALKPLLYTENDEIAMIASEEVAIRSVDGDATLEPRELAAGEVRWWLR